ncbi:MAG: MFS transporter [Phycisphaerae bacterium]|nr:MFS transporter [Phycisphaerae bacterium]
MGTDQDAAQTPASLGLRLGKAFREIKQPFVDLVHAPRALWGVNLGYFLEGIAYWGVLNALAIHFSDFIFAGMEHADIYSHDNVLVLSAGITIAMFLLGGIPDKFGVRFALLTAYGLMIVGRALMAAAPTVMGLQPAGLWSALQLVTLSGILFVVVGYGMYQPAAYAAVRQFTNPKTASMAYAMLYAVMNLGGWLPTFAFLIRDDEFLGWGIPGTYWIYTGITVVSLIVTAAILTRRTVREAVENAKAESSAIKAAAPVSEVSDSAPEVASSEAAVELLHREHVPAHMWLMFFAAIGAVYWRLSAPSEHIVAGIFAAIWIAVNLVPPTRRFLARHPLADAKFAFFIFALIPVQTLFTYNWLILPQYISRAYAGWVGDWWEIPVNANPLMIFIFVPIITALTQKAKVYNMMIWGTLVMGAPAFLLTIGPNPWILFTYLITMTVGEAMWQPRFLQYAAEIAPPGRTGIYIGVAQFPWFLTKLLVPALYSGWMLERYCPAEGARDTSTMWLIFACIAMMSPVALLLARGWVGKDFKKRS